MLTLASVRLARERALNAAPSLSRAGRNSWSCGRTRGSSALVIVAPIVQLTMLGYAATTDVNDVPVVVADGDRIAGEPRR